MSRELKDRAEREREIDALEKGSSLFKSIEEYDFYQWFNDYACNFHDEDCSGWHEAAERIGLSEEIADRMEQISNTLSAMSAGIPLSVILGKTKLRDHFSQDYIDFMCNRPARSED
jgi:hypothetical protein